MRSGGALRVACVIALALCATTSVQAQDYPTRPIEIIVPWGPGGGADQVARRIAKLLEPRLGVQVTTTNVSGASGQKGLARMRAAAADGYTLSVITGDTFGLLATQRPDWALDDVAPIAILIRQPSAFLVHEGGKYRSWKDIETAAKSESLRVAIAGMSTSDELTVNYLVRRGLRLVTVAFTKPGERHTALLNGSADILYEQIGDVRSFVENQQMRPVLLFADTRDERLKDIPTSHELGYQIRVPQFRALVVRSDTDGRAIDRLGRAMAEVADDPEYAGYLEQQFADRGSFKPAGEAAIFMRAQLDQLRALVAEQNAMVDR
jgi:tripartite-type tricarboxylate transporter receptor subunit TctC